MSDFYETVDLLSFLMVFPLAAFTLHTPNSSSYRITSIDRTGVLHRKPHASYRLMMMRCMYGC